MLSLVLLIFPPFLSANEFFAENADEGLIEDGIKNGATSRPL